MAMADPFSVSRLVLLSLALPAAAPALCPSNVKIQLTDTSLEAAFETDAPGRGSAVRLRYGARPDMPNQGQVNVAYHPESKRRFLSETDLRPGTPKLYFDPQVSEASGKLWSSYEQCQAQLCPAPGAQAGGYSCEDDSHGALIPFVAVPEDSGKLELPQLPRHARPDPRQRPTINGKVTILTDCSGVQQALDDHGSKGTKDTGLNHEIRLPPGRICRAELEDSRAGKKLSHYTLPEKSGAGVTILTCGGDPNTGPPPGVQHSPRFRTSQSCGFGINHETVHAGSPFAAGGALFQTGRCQSELCTQGWRFENLIVEAGNWRDFSPRKVAVTAVDINTGRVTLAEPVAGLFTGNAEVNFNLPGIRTMVRNHDRSHADLAQRGCLVVTPGANELACGGIGRMTGAYEGGGYVTAAQGYEVEQCESQDGNTVCTLKDDHGLGNFPALPIRALAGGQLEIDGEAHGWNKHATVLIEGNASCNGIYTVEAIPAAGSAKLARTGCSGAGGTARRLYMGRFFELKGGGGDSLEGAHLVDFPGPKRVRAFNVDLKGGTVESGGFVYTNPKISAFFSLPAASGLTWDRILFALGAPFRIFNVFGLASNQDGSLACDCAIVDSHVEGLHFWQPISPGAGVVEPAQTYPAFSAIPVFVRAHVVKDLQLDGITFSNGVGFAFFADQFGAPGPQDVTFRRLSTIMPDALIAGQHSKGLAHNARHFIEVKAGQRLLFDGLQIQGWASVGVAGAAPIFLSYRSQETDGLRVVKDVTIRNLFMRNVSVGITAGTTGVDASSPQEPVRRILIDNWLLDGVNYPNRQAAPHDQGLDWPGTFYQGSLGSGFALSLNGPLEDVKVSRVTARRLRSKNVPNFLWISGARSNGIQIDRSIIAYSPSGPEPNGVAPYVHQTRSLVPPIVEGGAQGFQQWASWLGEPDPRTWFGTPAAPIGVIPCLSDSSLPYADFGRKNNVKSAADKAFGCSGRGCGQWNVLVAGKDRQSCQEREALVLDQDLNGIGEFKGLGADTLELAKALGYIRSQITQVTSSGAQLVYVPLSEEQCTVDHGRDPEFKTYIRGKDTGGEGNRAVLLGGYSPGETAYYRLLCPRSMEVSGEFKTAAE